MLNIGGSGRIRWICESYNLNPAQSTVEKKLHNPTQPTNP